MSIMSFVSLAVSVLGVVIYGTLFTGSGLTGLFVVLSIASVILPPIAKKLRIKKNKKGKALEIISIVIGGFNFYCIFFALTSLPILIGYLGWVICVVAYRMVKVTEKQDVWMDSQCTKDNSLTERDKIRFCRKCGELLLDNSSFCRKCGAEVVRD